MVRLGDGVEGGKMRGGGGDGEREEVVGGAEVVEVRKDGGRGCFGGNSDAAAEKWAGLAGVQYRVNSFSCKSEGQET